MLPAPVTPQSFAGLERVWCFAPYIGVNTTTVVPACSSVALPAKSKAAKSRSTFFDPH